MTGVDEGKIGELESRISQLESLVDGLLSRIYESDASGRSESDETGAFQSAVPVQVLQESGDVEVDDHSIEEGEGEKSGGFGGGALSIKGWGGEGKKEAESVTLSKEDTSFDILARSGSDTKFVKLKLKDEGGGEGGEVTLHGTDSSSDTGSDFKFKSATYSNVKVHVEDGDITVGVYYV